jgi:hypothetical protein
MRSASCSSARSRSLEELRAEVVVAALALDRLEDDGGDVVGVLAEVRVSAWRTASASRSSMSVSSSLGAVQ